MELLTANSSQSPPELSDFELQKITRFFEILLTIEKRVKKQDDLRTDKPNSIKV